MAKLTLTDMTTLSGGLDTLNDNNTSIETAIENTLSRDGTTPNQMSSDFDMNSNDILNIKDINYTGNLYYQGQAIVVTDDIANLSTTGVGLNTSVTDANIFLSFDTRAELITYWTAGKLPAGVVLSANGFLYEVVTGSTSITDANGLEPYGVIGHAEHFGAVGDGVINADKTIQAGYTDDAAALQAAKNWEGANASRLLVLQRGKVYVLDSSVTYTGKVAIIADGAIVAANGNFIAFDFSNTVTGPYALNASYTAGGTSLDVTGDALPSAPDKNIWMKIMSFADDIANRDQGSGSSTYRTGEWFLTAASSTTTTIQLAKALRVTEAIDPVSTAGDEARIDPYRTNETAQVLWPDNDVECYIRGLHIVYDDGNDAVPWDKPALRVRGYVKPRLEKLTFGRCYDAGLRIVACIMPIVDTVDVTELENDNANGQLGYGVSYNTEGMILRNVTGVDTRHVFTSSVSTIADGETDPILLIGAGRCFGNVIDGVIGYGGDNGQADTHHASEGDSITRIKSYNGNNRVGSFRGRNLSISDVTAVGTTNGLYFYTEFDDNDADEDYFTNGKEKTDFTSAQVNGPVNLDVVEVPLEFQNSNVVMNGPVKVLTQDHCMLNVSGGEVHLHGDYKFTSKAGGVTHSDTGVITMTNPNANSAYSASDLYIWGNVEIDASLADAATVNLWSLESSCTVHIFGRLKVLLPDGAGWGFTGSGTIRCDNEGIIEYEVNNASDDNAIISDAGDLINCKVRSEDNTVLWDDSKPTVNSPGQNTFYDANVDVNQSNATLTEDVYVPDGQYVGRILNNRGEGYAKIILTGAKTGSTGDATLEVDSGPTNPVATFTIPAATNNWELHMTCHFESTNNQIYTGRLELWDNAGAGTYTVERFRKAETFAFSAHNNPIFAFNVQTDAADTLNFDHCEIWSTTGGIF